MHLALCLQVPGMMVGIDQKNGKSGITHSTTNSGLRLKNIPFCPRVARIMFETFNVPVGVVVRLRRHRRQHVWTCPQLPASAGRLCCCSQGLVPPVYCLEGPAHVCEVSCQSGGDLVAIQRQRLGKHVIYLRDLWKVPPSRCCNHGRAGLKSTSVAGSL